MNWVDSETLSGFLQFKSNRVRNIIYSMIVSLQKITLTEHILLNKGFLNSISILKKWKSAADLESQNGQTQVNQCIRKITY